MSNACITRRTPSLGQVRGFGDEKNNEVCLPSLLHPVFTFIPSVFGWRETPFLQDVVSFRHFWTLVQTHQCPDWLPGVPGPECTQTHTTESTVLVPTQRDSHNALIPPHLRTPRLVSKSCPTDENDIEMIYDLLVLRLVLDSDGSSSEVRSRLPSVYLFSSDDTLNNSHKWFSLLSGHHTYYPRRVRPPSLKHLS